MIPVAQFIQHFPVFGWTPCLVGISNYSPAQKKNNNFNNSLTDLAELGPVW